MLRTKTLWIIVGFSVLLSSCAGKPHVIGYDIIKSPFLPPGLGRLYLASFDDQRPQEEREGVKGKLLAFSSKDAHFNKKITLAIEEILAAELTNVGFSIVEEKDYPDYRIFGSLKHFQAIMSPAKITFLPYLGSLSTLWAKDDFTIALSIYIRMTDQRGRTLIDKVFDVSQDMELPTGLLNLARYSRGFNYKLKLLDVGLEDVIGQIRDAVLSKVKK